MRGEASRIADRESRDSLAPKLRDTREDAWRIGNELFTITKVLDDSIQLERALTDPSRPVADKVAVLKELLGDNAHPMTMEIMTDLVSRRWSRARDIANAVEDFGVDAMMYYADATDATLQVSIELSELHSAGYASASESIANHQSFNFWNRPVEAGSERLMGNANNR